MFFSTTNIIKKNCMIGKRDLPSSLFSFANDNYTLTFRKRVGAVLRDADIVRESPKPSNDLGDSLLHIIKKYSRPFYVLAVCANRPELP